MNNICKFISASRDSRGINIINFVYETKAYACCETKILPVYRAALVLEGKGKMKTYSHVKNLEKGDLFFNFPSVPFSMACNEDFKYIYISYLGVRANMLADKFGINPQNCIIHDMGELEPLWKTAIQTSGSELKSEAVLLYTLAVIGERLPGEKDSKSTDAVIMIKKYIDENFTSSDLNLKKISEETSYNEKYISTVFKKHFRTCISEYLTTIRIQYACTLMEQGLSSISDIALLCGYTDPLYFSKVFKKRMGMPPRNHIKLMR